VLATGVLVALAGALPFRGWVAPDGYESALAMAALSGTAIAVAGLTLVRRSYLTGSRTSSPT
jgi:hypothetical protein